MSGPQPITIDQLGRLAVDASGRLYWDGKEIVTTLSLPWYVDIAIIIGATAAVISAAWPVVRYFFLDRKDLARRR
jgi:hypothetical protein